MRRRGGRFSTRSSRLVHVAVLVALGLLVPGCGLASDADYAMPGGTYPPQLPRIPDHQNVGFTTLWSADLDAAGIRQDGGF